jgi:hypothetical protein
MAAGKQQTVRKRRSDPADGGEGDKLPYRVELWNGEVVDRVLALAGHVSLARAIYRAATAEHPDRVVVLSRGPRIIARTDGR